MTRITLSSRNKYNACKTYSELCGRMFDSKAEARRGEELALLQRAGEIRGLKYQVKYVLSEEKPRITYTVDFEYYDTKTHEIVREDAKGLLLRETRVKLAWLKEKHGITVSLVKGG